MTSVKKTEHTLENSEYIRYADSDTLTILNSESTISNQLYHMRTPYLVTYGFCSGTGESDYINFVTLSETDREIYQEPYRSHEEYFKLHPTHFHDYFELMIVLEGTVIQKIENREYRYDAGTCCLITRSLCHSETFDCSARIIFIGLSLDFIQKMFDAAKHSSFSEESRMLCGAIYDFIMNDIKSPGQKAYLDFIPTSHNSNKKSRHRMVEDLISALINPHFGTEYLVWGLICSIINRLSSPDFYHCTLTSLDHSSDFLIFSRVEHILQENDGRVTRSELSALLNYSGDYLNRIVNKYTGMCLSDYGMQFCLNKACVLLKTTDLSVSAIALELGFTNRTFFYKLFQKQYKMTPKEYRAMIKGNS